MENTANASLIKRFIAFVIDLAVSLVAVVIAYLVLAMFISDKQVVSILTAFIYLAWYTLYFVYFHWKYGKTLGKKIMGIKMVNLDESPVTLGTAFKRWLMTFVSIGLWIVTVIMLFVNKEKRAWHDLVAKTKVIDSK